MIAIVLIAIIGDWNPDAALKVGWRLPAALLLLGLAYEHWMLSRARWRVQLDAPAKIYLGRETRVELSLAHALARRLDVEVSPTAPSFVAMDPRIEALRIEPEHTGSFVLTVTGTRLGEFAWPETPLRVAGPLGLAWWPREVSCGCSIRVMPDLLRSEDEAKSVAAIGASPAVQAGGGAEVLRLRDYREGDPPRLVDWKATARAGRLISRDYSQERGLSIVLLVDAGRSSELRAGSLDRFAHYVNVAARLAQYAASREDLVGLVVYADRPLAALAPARGAPAVSRLRAVLAASQIERTESNPMYAVARVKSLVRHRSLVIVLTDFDDASAQSQLAHAVRFLLPKHLPFVAGLSSAAAERLATTAGTDWLDPYKSLAAQEYCTGLERKVRSLNAMGAPALAARPELLERAVFAAYERFNRQRRA
ncbi:MAG TPA: DUF58 domain-containing protein [Steroidobacteraceae bacterium]